MNSTCTCAAIWRPLIWDLNVLPVMTEAPNVPVIEPEQMRTVAATQAYNAAYAGAAPAGTACGGQSAPPASGSSRIRVTTASSSWTRPGNLLTDFGSHCNINDSANTPCVDPDGDGPLALGDGQFYEPWGVAADTAGNIYVADTWNGRIQVFDRAGNFLRKWGLFATTNGEAGDPTGALRPARPGHRPGRQPAGGRHGQQAHPEVHADGRIHPADRRGRRGAGPLRGADGRDRRPDQRQRAGGGLVERTRAALRRRSGSFSASSPCRGGRGATSTRSRS